MKEKMNDPDGHQESVVAFAVPSFSRMDTSILKAIALASRECSYDVGEAVFLEGDPAEGLYVVREGWLKAYRISMKGRERVVRFVGPADTFN